MFRHRGNGLRIIVIAMVLVAGISIALVLNSSRINKATYARTEQFLAGAVQSQAATLEAVFDGQLATMKAIANGAAFAADFYADDTAAKQSYLASAKAQTSFTHLFWDSLDGDVLSEEGAQAQISDRLYFQRAREGEATITFVDDARITHDRRLIFAVPVMQDGAVIAVMHGSFDEVGFRELLEPSVYVGQSYSFICDGDGEILLQSNSANFLLSGYTNFFDFLAASHITDAVSVEDIRVQLAQGEKVSVSYESGGQKRYAAGVPLDLPVSDGGRWLLFNVAPSEVASAEISEATNNGLVLVVIVLLVALLTIGLIVLNTRREKRAREAETELLHRREEQYRIVVQQSNKFIYRYDIATRATYREHGVVDGFGYDEVIENVPDSQLDQDLIDERSKASYVDFFRRIREGESPVSTLTHMKTQGGEWVWYRSDATTVFDAKGRPVEAVIAYYDVTEEYEHELAYRRQMEEKALLEVRLRTDSLTGVLTRQSFLEQVKVILDLEEPETNNALIMIDVDEFKSINDTFGHQVGDEVLAAVAADLGTILREDDKVGRFGGDEFMVFLRNVVVGEGLEKRVAAINDGLRNRIEEDFLVSASIGVAVYPSDGMTFEELYKHADDAMYQAKKAGRDSYVFYDTSLGESAGENDIHLL